MHALSPLSSEKNPKCRLDYPQEPGWGIFQVCDGVDFQFSTLSFFALFHLSLVLSTMKVTSLGLTRFCPIQSLSLSFTQLMCDLHCNNVFCFNLQLLITDNQSFPFKVKHLSESWPRSATLLSVTSGSIHSSKLVRPGPSRRSLLPDGGDKNSWLSERRDS